MDSRVFSKSERQGTSVYSILAKPKNDNVVIIFSPVCQWNVR